MTERMLPSGDGPTACPFVAFDDDRDHRAAAADHRHRCYAEVRPAVRSHAHQDAFCVSAAFPACPTFLDWARREAAVARPGRPDRHADESEPGSPAGPIGRPSTSPDRPVDPPTEGGPAVPPTTALPRRGRRDWAAPPPWSVQPAPGGDGGSGAGPAAPASAGLSASADRWLGPEEGRGVTDPASSPAIDPRDASLPPAMRATSASSRSPFASGPQPWERGRAEEDEFDDDDLDFEEDDDDGYEADEEGDADGDGPRRGRRGGGRSGRARAGSERGGRRLGRGRIPEWETPVRQEAYPSLRLRLGMPAVSPVGLWFAALMVAAAVLFFVPPMLLGLGGEEAVRSTPSPTELPTEPPGSPTPEPSPTPRLYVVVSGDTLGRIADRFGLTIADLMAANPSITNENIVKLGQEIVIPTAPPETIPDGSSVDGATTVEDPSASPSQ